MIARLVSSFVWGCTWLSLDLALGVEDAIRNFLPLPFYVVLVFAVALLVYQKWLQMHVKTWYERVRLMRRVNRGAAYFEFAFQADD